MSLGILACISPTSVGFVLYWNKYLNTLRHGVLVVRIWITDKDDDLNSADSANLSRRFAQTRERMCLC